MSSDSSLYLGFDSVSVEVSDAGNSSYAESVSSVLLLDVIL